MRKQVEIGSAFRHMAVRTKVRVPAVTGFSIGRKALGALVGALGRVVRNLRGSCLLVAIGCGPIAATASAAEIALTYQAVMHTTEVHGVPVPGVAGREIGVAAFRGLAIFDDGRIANHRYVGHFDFQDQNGPIAGEALWVFDDGSTLRARYAGDAVAAGAGITFTGSHSAVSGSGTYADAEGSGTFEGRRVDHLADGGDTYYSGTLDLTVPGQQ